MNLYLQERILVMHESPLICPLLNITLKAPVVVQTLHDVDIKGDTAEGGFSFGEFICFMVKLLMIFNSTCIFNVD